MRDALAINPTCTNIHIAKGTYKPTSDTNRDSAFAILNSNIKLLGGYPSGGGPRNPSANPVYLDGNIGDPGTYDDNSVHVVVITDIANNNDSLVLDGLTIRNGNASGYNYTYGVNEVSGIHGGGISVSRVYMQDNAKFVIRQCAFVNNRAGFGGGMVCWLASPTLNTVTFTGNAAGIDGGGMHNSSCSPTLINTSFSGNSAQSRGGGMFNDMASPNLTYVVFNVNTVSDYGPGSLLGGGGMYNNISSPILTHVTFTGNTAGINNGGGMCNYIASPTLTDVAFTGNHAGIGGGMYNLSSSPILTNGQFTGNTATQPDGSSGGMDNQRSSPLLNYVTFSNNTGYNAGAISNTQNSAPVLKNVTLSGNTGHYAGALYNHNSSPVLTNVLITGNKADSAGGVYSVGLSSVITNTTISGNKGYGIWNVGNADCKISNSIIYDNEKQIFGDTLYTKVVSSMVEGGYAGTGNLRNSPPLFVQAPAYSLAPFANGNYHLEKCSPAINAGINDSLPSNTASDIAGNTRIQGAAVDMGAYEYMGNPVFENTDVYVDASVASSGNGTSWSTAYKELREAMANTLLCGNATLHIAKGTYKPTADDADRASSFAILAGNVKLLGGYPPGGGARNPVANPVYLDGNIGDLSERRDNSYHVLVIAGLKPNNDSLVLDGLTIRNGYANGNAGKYFGETMVYDQNGGGIAAINVPMSIKWVIRQCIIEGNSASNNGGGMYNQTASPMLANTTVRNNDAVYGGGIYNSLGSSSTFNLVGFNNNSARYGSGVCNVSSSSSILSNTSFAYNKGKGSLYNEGHSSSVHTGGTFRGNNGDEGLAVYNSHYSLATLTNVLIEGNGRDIFNGTAVHNISNSSVALNNVTIASNACFGIQGEYGAPVSVNNSIIYGNFGAIWGDVASLTVTHSLIQDGLADNLNAAPLFVNAPPPYLASPGFIGNYHLQPCSPAINAGNNSDVPAGTTTDYSGNARIQGTAVDMGAYEFVGSNNGNPNGADLMATNGDTAKISIVNASTNTLMVTNSACQVLATILPNGSHAVTGTVNAKVFIDPVVRFYLYNNQLLPCLQRHYDIAPQTDAATATAQLTLYYTQAEFDAYNTQAVSDGKTLPTGPSDGPGKRRLRLFQYHGTSSDGSGLPSSYSGKGTLITPDEDKIVWNSGLQRWEITFNITGFSGFFLGVDPLVILPVKLVSFTGKLTDNEKSASLQWQVAAQQNIKEYVVERSVDGNSFQAVGHNASNQLSTASYTHSDLLPAAYSLLTMYYRLKIVGTDGSVTYSQVVLLNRQSVVGSKIILYPNPVSKGVLLQVSISNGVLRQYKLTTATGQVLLQKNGLYVTSSTSLSLPSALAAGVYYLQITTDNGVRNERVIVK